MSFTRTSHRLFVARPPSATLVDVAIAVATFGGSLAVIRHGGVGPSPLGSGELDVGPHRVDGGLDAAATVVGLLSSVGDASRWACSR